MTTRTVEDLMDHGRAARKAARDLARLSAGVKNETLNSLAGLLESDVDDLLEANAEDCEEARTAGLNEAMIDRLLLTPVPAARHRRRAAQNRLVARPCG